MSNPIDKIVESVEELLQPAAKLIDSEKRKDKGIVRTTVEAPFRAADSLFSAVTFGIFDDD